MKKGIMPESIAHEEQTDTRPAHIMSEELKQAIQDLIRIMRERGREEM